MDDVMRVLPGLKFIPSVEDLLVSYLMPKVCGEKLPCNIVHDRDIYGPNANPWHLFNDSQTSWTVSGKSEKSVYIFTRLTKIAAPSAGINNNKKTEHYVRKAGCGTWHDETGRERIMFRKGENVVIGYKRLLVYQINEIGGLGDGIDLDHAAYWKMHEYSLDGVEDYVVCKITWDASKRAKVVRSKRAEVVGAQVSRTNDGRLSSGGGLVQDVNIDCTLQPSTSCPQDVFGGAFSLDIFGDDFSLDMDNLSTDWSDEEFAEMYNSIFSDDTLNTLPESSAALSSPPDNDNDQQHPAQKSSRQVLGKRKSIETEQSGKRVCI